MQEVGAEEAEEKNIKLNSFVSFTLGDIRRTSFIMSAAERGMRTYGITCKSIFEGGKCVMCKLSESYL